jgi:ubiquinol-cytochrome c reductase cytochrome b subunit
MSYWGAQVIVNLFDALPLIGPDLSLWIRGDYVVSDATLNRFFAFHVIAIPLVLVGLVGAHLMALHEVGSNNPDGIEIKKTLGPDGHPLDGIPFHPYYTVKDTLGVMVFLALFAIVLFFMPEFGGYFLEYNNFIPADPLKTPSHIAPVWYFTPYYSILRATTADFMLVLAAGVLAMAFLMVRSDFIRERTKMIALVVTAILLVGFYGIDAKVWGVVLMGLAVMIFFLLPWLDVSPVKSIRYKGGLYKVALGVFVVVFLVLGYFGTQPVSPFATYMAQLCTLLYFAFFLLMPWYSRMDKTKPVPDRVTW